jgi:hypothetical protein
MIKFGDRVRELLTKGTPLPMAIKQARFEQLGDMIESSRSVEDLKLALQIMLSEYHKPI